MIDAHLAKILTTIEQAYATRLRFSDNSVTLIGRINNTDDFGIALFYDYTDQASRTISDKMAYLQNIPLAPFPIQIIHPTDEVQSLAAIETNYARAFIASHFSQYDTTREFSYGLNSALMYFRTDTDTLVLDIDDIIDQVTLKLSSKIGEKTIWDTMTLEEFLKTDFSEE